MGSVERRGKDRWRARYRGPDRRERSKTFKTQREGNDWLASQTIDLRRGDWSDPKLAQVTVGEWGQVWLDRKAARLKPSTFASYDSMVRCLILPTWANVRLGDVSFHEVDGWVAGLAQRLGPSSVRKAHTLLSQILETAVKDGRLSKNPARGVDLPRLVRRENRYLSHAQVASLIDASGDDGPLVMVLAYCGLRFGEAAALRVRNVDLLRGRIRVTHSMTEVRGELVLGTPKNHAFRSVPVPRFVRAVLDSHLLGKAPDDFVFTSPEGRPLRNNNFRHRSWNRATETTRLTGLRPHDLRHTAASMAVDAGANVKAVQRMLGHASASMTLDVYADLFEEALDHVSDRLDAAHEAALAASPWPPVASHVNEIGAANA